MRKKKKERKKMTKSNFLGVCFSAPAYSKVHLQVFLPAGRVPSARPAGPKITFLFPRLLVCASALITCAIITSRTLLPCDITLVDFGNLDGRFA